MSGQYIGVTVVYRDIFPHEQESKTYQELLEGVSSNRVLTYLAYLNTLTHYGVDGGDKGVLAHAVQSFPHELREKIFLNYLNHIGKLGSTAHAFNTWTITKMIQEVLLHHIDYPTSIPNAAAEIQIFKAYLKFGEVLADSDDEMLPRNEVIYSQPFIEWIWMLFPRQLDYVTRINPSLQLFMVGVILNYLYSRKEYEKPIKSFLIAKGFSSPTDLFSNYYNLFLFNYIGSDEKKLRATALRPHKNQQKLVEHLVIDREKLKGQSDLQVNQNGLKLRPLIDCGDGSYLISNWNFFHGRIYNSLLFDLWENSDFNSIYRNFGDFKSDIVQSITEKFLFKKIIELNFTGSGKVVIFDDADSSDGFPDAYIRHGSRIYILEFKDTHMPSTVVDAGSYEKVRDHLLERFVRSKKGRKKGVTQLAEVISKLSTNPKYIEGGNLHRAKNLRIYPVIVYTHHYYSLPGVNSFLNEEFERQLRPAKQHFKYIYPMVMIDLDFFFNFVHAISSGNLRLSEVLSGYQNYLHGKSNAKDVSLRTKISAYSSLTDYLKVTKRTNIREAGSIMNIITLMDSFDLPMQN